MRAGSAISIAAALVLGVVAVLLARSLLPSGDTGPVRRIVVASRSVGFGATLSSDNLREVTWPADAALDGSFSSIADLTRDGRRLALAPLQANEPVLRAKVTAPNGRATLSTQIDEGMRAVTVRVDEVRGVAGFVLPGDRVDVILTRGEASGTDAAAFADVLLQDTKVLAVDQVVGERQDKPSVARAVTLELAIADAQRVILAQGIGRLSLVLRQSGESSRAPAPRVTAAGLGSDSGPTTAAMSSFEKKLDEVMKRVTALDGRPAPAAPNLAEFEARLRADLARVPPAQPALVKRPVVNVIRNASKREEYSVSAEP